MKLRITSVVAPEVRELVSSITIPLEDQLRPIIEARDYGGGIRQFVIFIVSVDADTIENERYCQANNRAGRYKDLSTEEMVKFVGLAVPVNPQLVLSSSKEELLKEMKKLIFYELESPKYKMPEKFDMNKFISDLRAALA
jgi:hypothetical protein